MLLPRPNQSAPCRFEEAQRIDYDDSAERERVLLGASPHFSPVAPMIAEDFGSVRVLATESIAGTTVEVARARTGPKDRRGRGQRSLQSLKP